MKNSLGKKVKTFKDVEPLQDLTSESKIISVYFKAATGEFLIYLPDHIDSILDNNFKDDINTKLSFSYHGGAVRSLVMESVIEGWKYAVHRFLKIQREAKRKKVIVFTMRYNGKNHNGSNNKSGGISFVDSPALHFSYETFYEVAGKLYRDFGEGRMNYSGVSKKEMDRAHDGTHHQIDWTAEREQFFEAMEGALNGLIDKLVLFTDALDKNPEKAIADFSSRLLLAAPNKETVK